MKETSEKFWERFYFQKSKNVQENSRMFQESRVYFNKLGMLIDLEVFDITDILDILKND